MSYERVRILRVTPVKGDNGDSRLYVEFERLEQARFRIDKHEYLRPEFESLLGKEALIPLRAGTFEGRPFWSLDGDARPIPMPSMSDSSIGSSSGPRFPNLKTGT